MNLVRFARDSSIERRGGGASLVNQYHCTEVHIVFVRTRRVFLSELAMITSEEGAYNYSLSKLLRRVIL
jgi:hypothetical protein